MILSNWRCAILPHSSSSHATLYPPRASSHVSTTIPRHERATPFTRRCAIPCARHGEEQLGSRGGRCTRRRGGMGSPSGSLYQNVRGLVPSHCVGPQLSGWPPRCESERSETPRPSVSRRRGRACQRAWRLSERGSRGPRCGSVQSSLKMHTSAPRSCTNSKF